MRSPDQNGLAYTPIGRVDRYDPPPPRLGDVDPGARPPQSFKYLPAMNRSLPSSKCRRMSGRAINARSCSVHPGAGEAPSRSKIAVGVLLSQID